MVWLCSAVVHRGLDPRTGQGDQEVLWDQGIWDSLDCGNSEVQVTRLGDHVVVVQGSLCSAALIQSSLRHPAVETSVKTGG